MKQLINPRLFKHAFMLIVLSAISFLAWAQDTTVTATTTTTAKTETTWYAEPWVWAVGGAVLILLIVLLVKGSSSSTSSRTDKVIVTKTTEVE